MSRKAKDRNGRVSRIATKATEEPQINVSAVLREEEKTIAKGTFWSLMGNVAFKIISFAHTIILARLFFQEDVGTFYLALSIIYLFSILSDLGMNSVFWRYIPFYIGKGEKEKVYKLLGTAYIFSGTISLLLGIMIFSASGLIAEIFKTPQLQEVMQFISIFFILNTFFSINLSFLNGLKKIKETAFINNMQNLLKLILTVFFYFLFGPKAVVIVLALTLSYVLLLFVSFLYVHNSLRENKIKKPLIRMHERISLLREVMPFGITLSFVAAMWWLVNYTDRIMLGYLLPTETAIATVGVYSMAVSLAITTLIFPSAVITVFSPVIAELYGKNKMDEIKFVSKTALRWSIFIMVPITVLLIVFPEELLRIFYGAIYAPGATVLAIFSASLFVRYLSFIHGTILGAMRIVRIELIAVLIATILNITLNLFLIPRFGMEGAITASAISLISVSLILIYYSKKIAGFGFPADAFLPIFGGVLTLIFFFLLREPASPLIVSIQQMSLSNQQILGLLFQKFIMLTVFGFMFLMVSGVYFVSLIVLKAFSKEDRHLFSLILKKVGVPSRASLFFEKTLERFF